MKALKILGVLGLIMAILKITNVISWNCLLIIIISLILIVILFWVGLQIHVSINGRRIKKKYKNINKVKIIIIFIFLSFSASAQKVKIYFNPTQYWVFTNLNDSTKVASLNKDTLWVHKPELIKIVEQSTELRYLNWKGNVYRYRYAFYDKAYMWNKGKSIY